MQVNRKTQPFVDWIGVWAGYGDNDPVAGMSIIYEEPVGVKLSVQEPKKTGPIFTRKMPWEEYGFIHTSTIIFDQGKYRMWYRSMMKPGFSENALFTCYAESEDGFNWTRPKLGLYELNGSKDNNILFETSIFNTHTVFIDKTAEPEERYKATGSSVTFLRNGKKVPDLSYVQFREIQKIAQQGEAYRPEEWAREWTLHQNLTGAVSPDGLNWKVIKKPILEAGETHLDTPSVCEYDFEREEYVIYARGTIERRRMVRRTSSKTFSNFSPTQNVLIADVQDGPDKTIYQPTYTRLPDSNIRVMFPAIYHQASQELDVQFAVSRDGFVWDRPERKTIINLHKPAGGKYSGIYPLTNLLPLADDKWGLPYLGMEQRHLYLREKRKPDGELCMAIWKRDRIVALEAEKYGRVTMIEREMAGRPIKLNFETERDGWVKVELVNKPTTPPSESIPFEGYGINDADFLTGNHLSKEITFKGSSDVSRLKGKNVSLRITLSRAKVYAIEW